MPLDPITLALVQNRLDFISRHMGRVMTRTARSPIFSQAHDFSCFLTDAAGTLVSNADGIPIHTGGGGFAVRALLETYREDLGEGDVFLLNDPYVAGGNHLPDWVVARPVFAADELVAFASIRAHQSDIGGGAAGTYNPEATEIFHEGLRLPPMRLVERGAVREDLWRLLQLNSRTPELLDGDLRAMLGATRIGAERIAALLEELGLEQGRRSFEGILDHAERRFRQAVAELPDGCYRGEESTWDCFEDRQHWIRLAVTVRGDEMVVDFSGTDAEMAGFKNSPWANTVSGVYMALLSFFEPDLPRNEGAFRGVDIRAAKGTLVHPQPPAPVTMCTVFVAHEIVHAMWKALAQADAGRASAGWGKPIVSVTAGGLRRPGVDGLRRPGMEAPEEPAEPFVLYHWHALSGAGAVEGRDGFHQLGHLITLGGLTLPEIETFETLYPARFERQEIRCDGGGVGEFRGGAGVHYAVRIDEPALYSFRAEGLGEPSGYGTQGGGAGAGGAMSLQEPGAESVPAPRYGLRRLAALRMEASSPGGGGWGDPLQRDPALVLRDVRDEVVSLGAAERVYGVVLDEPGRAVDTERTQALRQGVSAAPRS